MKNYLIIALVPILFSCGSETRRNEEVSLEDNFETEEEFNTIWNYEDEFSQEEKKKLKTWIRKVYDAAQETLGKYPFDLHVYFHRNDKSSAVTFGHTKRGKRQAVHFYVNPTYPLKKFLSDWIAPHEISHLSMPFVGKENSWYAEGYATYLSRKIMINMGEYSKEDFDAFYYSKIRENLAYYKSKTLTFEEVSDSLLSEYEYGEMYWGSTSFFMTSDSLLQINYQMTLCDLIADYQYCCRMEDKDIDAVMSSYDQLIGDTLFTHLLWQYKNRPSFEVMKGY